VGDGDGVGDGEAGGQGGMTMANGTEVVAALYAALESSDRARYKVLVDPDVEWEFMDGFPHGGTRHGLTAVLDETFTALTADFDDWHVELAEILAAEGAVVGLGRYRGRARATGREVTAAFCHVFRLRGDVIVRVQQFTDTARITGALAP
jgi:ketosteroid isomerase-like protein